MESGEYAMSPWQADAMRQIEKGTHFFIRTGRGVGAREFLALLLLMKKARYVDDPADDHIRIILVPDGTTLEARCVACQDTFGACFIHIDPTFQTVCVKELMADATPERLLEFLVRKRMKIA